MNSAAFGRAMGNVRKHKNMKFVTTERRRICVTTKLLYYKVFRRKLIKKLRKFIKLKLEKFNRKLYCSCKNRWYLQRHCRRSRNKIWHFKFWIRHLKWKKVIGLMKDKLGGEIMKEFAELRATTFGYLKDNNNEDKKKQKAQKSVSSQKNLNLKIIKTV